jgi:hypothetical protein
VLVLGVLAAVGAAYFNFDALRSAVLELPFVARWLGDRSAPGAVTAPPLPDESETVVVEPPRVVGVAEPTDEDGEPVNQSAAPARSAEPAVSAAAPAEQPVAAVAPEPAPPPPPPPEPPPGPETLALGSATVTVSEGAASAAVLVLRYGDTRRASSVVWSTRDGTARAGSDYVDRGAVVERFAPGEQNRRILVPIVGDRNAEGPETFYVVLTVEDDAAAGQIRETEVVITDDD